MIEMYGGGPVGLGTLSVNIAEERETVEDMYEPLPDSERFHHANSFWTGGNC